MSLSKIDQLLYVDLKPMKRETKHILLSGMTGSGKTSQMLKYGIEFVELGETVIWRDDANFEFLSFLDMVPVRAFIPSGCDFGFNHEMLEKVHYDPSNTETIFNNLQRGKLHVILLDAFVYSADIFINFWSRFFYDLWRWKTQCSFKKVCVMIDELNDLAPGVRRGYIPDQMQISSNLWFGFKKFRKMGLRLIGSTHEYRGLHVPVRESFNYYVWRKSRKESVPHRFENYASLVEKMPINKMLVVDEDGNFNRIDVDEVVKPRRFDVRPLTLNPDLEELFSKRRKEQQESERLAFAFQALKECGFKTKTILQLFNYRGKGALEKLQHTSVDEDSFKKAVEQVKDDLEEMGGQVPGGEPSDYV